MEQLLPHLLHLVAALAMMLKEWMNLCFQGTIVMCSLTQDRHPSRRGTAVFFVKNTRKHFLGPLTLGRDAHMHSVCNVAVTYICMAHGGVKDLRKHESTALHSRSEQSTVGAMPLPSYYDPVRGSAVIEAEVKFGYFLGEHHLAFKLVNHATKLFSSMFPDSAIVKEFKCGRTKATTILRAIAQDSSGSIEAALKESKYISLQTDKTTD